MPLFKLHPVNQIVSFLLSAILLMHADVPNLYGYVFIALLSVAIFNLKAFKKALIKLKWIFLAIILVFSLTTPGQLVLISIPTFSPTYEGLQAGATQLMRIIGMLALLSVTVFLVPRMKLLAGIYQLLLPLKILRLNTSLFVMRLGLVFEYINFFQKNNQIQQVLQRLFQGQMPDLTFSKSQKTLLLDLEQYKWVDVFVLAMFWVVFCCLF